MLQSICSCWALCGIEGQTRPDKVLRSRRDVLPIFLRFKFVVAGNDGLHLKLLSVTIEWGVACKQEVGDDPHRPYVDGLAVSS